MPRRNLSVLSSDEDPYTLDRFPRAFAVAIGKQTYNARQLAKAAKVKGQWMDMYRQPIPAAKVREILALTGQRPHANTGRFMPASGLAKVRKLAKRELLARQGKAVVGPMQYPTAPRPPRAGSSSASDAYDTGLVTVAETMLRRARGRLVGRNFSDALEAADALLAGLNVGAVPGAVGGRLRYEAHEVAAAALARLGRLVEALARVDLAFAAADALEEPARGEARRLLTARGHRLRAMTDERLMLELGTRSRRGSYPSSRR
jgi:hypothetical protein